MEPVHNILHTPIKYQFPPFLRYISSTLSDSNPFKEHAHLFINCRNLLPYTQSKKPRGRKPGSTNASKRKSSIGQEEKTIEPRKKRQYIRRKPVQERKRKTISSKGKQNKESMGDETPVLMYQSKTGPMKLKMKLDIPRSDSNQEFATRKQVLTPLAQETIMETKSLSSDGSDCSSSKSGSSSSSSSSDSVDSSSSSSA